MPNKNTKKKLKAKNKYKDITKGRAIQIASDSIVPEDDNSQDELISLEYNEVDIDEILTKEDIGNCQSLDTLNDNIKKEEKIITKTSGFDSHFLKRVDIKPEEKKIHKKNLIHKMIDVEKRLDYIVSRKRKLNVVMIAEKPKIASIISNSLNERRVDPKIWNNYLDFKFDHPFKGYNASFTVCSVFGHVYNRQFHKNLKLKDLQPADLFSEKIERYQAWEKINHLNQLTELSTEVPDNSSTKHLIENNAKHSIETCSHNLENTSSEVVKLPSNESTENKEEVKISVDAKNDIFHDNSESQNKISEELPNDEPKTEVKKITSQIKEENQNPIIDLDAIMKEERKTNEDKAKIKNDKKDTVINEENPSSKDNLKIDIEEASRNYPDITNSSQKRGNEEENIQATDNKIEDSSKPKFSDKRQILEKVVSGPSNIINVNPIFQTFLYLNKNKNFSQIH